MSNLSIENLSGAIQSGQTSRLFEGGVERPITPGAENSVSGGRSFGDVLRESVDKVNEYQAQADTAIKELVSGRNKNIHETMLTVERADASLKLMMQVRNKMLEAYREVMRMQV